MFHRKRDKIACGSLDAKRSSQSNDIRYPQGCRRCCENIADRSLFQCFVVGGKKLLENTWEGGAYTSALLSLSVINKTGTSLLEIESIPKKLVIVVEEFLS